MNIKNLKAGDKVFIREDLVPGKFYGALTYERNMDKGWCEVSGVFSKSGTFSVKTDNGKRWEILYSYTLEMVDWEKTIKLQNNNYCEFEKITQFVENGKEKTVALTNNGKKFTVTNNDKENDIEKAVMLLILKSLGITYGDVKKEVEKVKVKWIPKDGEKYYYIKTTGDVDFLYWVANSHDNGRLTFNNCFKTREEAEEKLEKIKEILKGE